MAEQSIRDELIAVIASAAYNAHFLAIRDDRRTADRILSSSVIRNVQAEAFDQGKQAGFTQSDDEWRGRRKVREATNPYRISYKAPSTTEHAGCQKNTCDCTCHGKETT